MSDARTEMDKIPTHGLSMRDALILLAKHKRIILLCFAVATAAAVLAARTLPPSYQVTAKVLVRIDQETIPSFFNGIAASREATTLDSGLRRLENEIQLMESQPLSAQVVADLGLTYDQIYHTPLRHLATLLASSLDALLVRYFDRRPTETHHGLVEIADAFRKSLSVKLATSKSADTGADVLEVTLRGVDPVLTAKALQRLLDIYTAHDKKMNAETGRQAYEVVLQQLQQAKGALAAAQTRLGAHIAANGLLARSAGGEGSAERGPLRSGTSLSTPGDASPVAMLKSRLMAMEIDLVSMRKTYPGRTDQIHALQSAIAEIRQRLAQEQRLAADNETTLLVLDRELRMGETLYMELERRLSQIGFFLAVNAGQGGNRLVIEPPLVPRESNLRNMIVLAGLASIAGLLLGIGLAAVQEMFDHRLESEAAVRELGIPVLAVIPRAGRRQRQRTLKIGQILVPKEA